MKQDSFSEYQQWVQNAITALIHEFCTNPFTFIYEADLQAYLYAQLFNKFKIIPKFVEIENGLKGQTTLLHAEMRIIGTRNHFDVGIWDDERSEFNTQGYKKKPTAIAVEIKNSFKDDFRRKLYGKKGKDGKRHGGHLQDIERLWKSADTDAEFFGYALFFSVGPHVSNLIEPEIKKVLHDFRRVQKMNRVMSIFVGVKPDELQNPIICRNGIRWGVIWC